MLNHIASVIAENAPIGVQLWPTVNPESAPNFTLAMVEIVRDAYGMSVRWTYEGGNVRSFELGQCVTVDGMALGEWMMTA